MATDLYQELGVSRGSSSDEIRKAFRKLAKQLHPDQNPGDKAAEERFKKVSAAFDILGDEEKRKKYDAGQIDSDGRETMRGFRPGENPFCAGGGPFAGGFHREGGPGGFEGHFEGGDFGDILSEILGGRRGGGAGFGGFGGQPARGQDVRAEIAITVEEAVQGGKKRIAFSDGRTLDVSIPKGAAEGQVLRLKGQGGQGRGGAGDALIELHIASHPVFKREGANLTMDVPVSVPDAVLGGKIEAPTPDGPVTLTVPKGANSGQILRLKGRGLGDPATGRRGDLLARLMVTLPDTVDPELQAFAEDWQAKRPYTPRRR
ncbi:MAG: DnaJ C-terminal domain-containing protein [Caulobacteraceae bacterium]